MYALTNKSGNKTLLFSDIDKLFHKYSIMINYHNSNSYNDIINIIDNYGYFHFIINLESFYIIKTTTNFANII